jgi:hypothetical protein
MLEIFIRAMEQETFIGLNQVSRRWGLITVNPTSGNVYALGINIVGGVGYTYMQPNGIGDLIAVSIHLMRGEVSLHILMKYYLFLCIWW